MGEGKEAGARMEKPRRIPVEDVIDLHAFRPAEVRAAKPVRPRFLSG